ncbi:UCH-domain-containing protein [Lindgomyces ingoldianus]|uniref:UCH-domain-containing protein n=1 Tax=Lindgomyces ingoldianus TaxID=673940 RepID=A0ACB6QG05_9PLEO|nr:UCH-domain-containing protein [Lindgomyces ingoldianus]KAF2465810.1 UCH-domain-containing protein [Lindgomyces ingoldianus]
MDPESVAFTPRDDLWRFQSEMLRVQQSQAELADRVSRLERRQEEDSRLKNVWGTSSPFPSVLGGTPQQVPLQQPTAEHFSNFDDHSSNLIGNLQLDTDDEPRRIGTTSRANSVRFDETANHGHWAHASRSSLDLIPRTGSGMGGHLMSERSYSHKSDGRQSSAGHSVHSATSGRANSLTGFGLNTPLEPPGLAPGLFILGSVPAIIRCWLNTNFKHDSLLYAAVCSGSYASYLDLRLINSLGFEDQITKNNNGNRKIKLSVYLPEAVPVSASSRSSSPAPQLPLLSVDFTVIERDEDNPESKAIQIFLGSDLLRAHNGDILFSTNHLTLYDDDRSKLQIPLVRPEDERTFKSLYVTSGPLSSLKQEQPPQKSSSAPSEVGTVGEGSVASSTLELSVTSASKTSGLTGIANSEDGGSTGRQSMEQRPFLGLSTIRTEPKEGAESSPASAAPRTSPAIWSNWRRDTEKPGTMDWANVGKPTSSTYQRQNAGIKVLKPTAKSGTRTLSSSVSQASSPAAAGQSRFFDEGRRRTSNAGGSEAGEPQLKRSASGEKGKEAPPMLTKTRSANPRRIVTTTPSSEPTNDPSAAPHSHSPHEGSGLRSPRSSPLPPSSTSLRASASPPRYLPPHMHDEVFEATQDSGSLARDINASAASSPSEAYANLTLESREHCGTMAQDSDTAPRANSLSEQPLSRPPPRSSSPAKRLHSDMDDTGKEKMDVDSLTPSTRRGSGQGSPRPTKPLPAAAQRGMRATSVDMVDAAANGESLSSSESNTASNPESTATSLSGTTPASGHLPSLDEQVTRVSAICYKPLQEGQEGYVVSDQWLGRVWARTSEHISKTEEFPKSAREGDIGPVDSSDLLDTAALPEELADQNGDEFVPLRPGLTMGHNFEILPAEAWELIMGWYGLKEGNPVIRRYVHNTAVGEFQENLQYEVYPPIFTIRKLRRSTTDAQTLADSKKRSPKVVASRSDSYMQFLKAAKQAAGVDMKRKVQVWRVLNTPGPTGPEPQQPSGMLTPDSSPRNGSPVASPPQRLTPPLLIDLASFNELAEGTEREMVSSKDETANEKYNGHLTLGVVGLAEDQVLILEEDEKGAFASETSRKVGNKNKTGGKGNKTQQSNSNSGRNSPALSGPMTRGRTRSGKTRGTVGLTNLGNTCYMNSALQCIRSVEELSWYFLQGNYKHDLNAENPLGHAGTIAKSYAGLLASIYDESAVSSFSPKNFKLTLGRAQPLFSGYGQQDSQEFLSFLVDGLHEDLNRVKEKPYTENPESDDKTVHDPEAIKALGEKFREIHHSRNDSVAMDLFNGFYKNTMVCPDCDKVSITFDPYSLLTLQLPIEQTWQHTITFVPLYGPMVNIEVDIDKNGTIKTLKEYISKRFPGTKWNRLMGAEVYSHKFYRVLDNNKSIAECNIGTRDDIFFFELDSVPTNWPPPKKPHKYRSMIFPTASSEEDIPNSGSPLADRMLVPVFHRAQGMTSYRPQQFSLVLWPSYIVVNREEAKDYDTILRKVIAKVAQMTTRPILAEYNGSYASLDQSRAGSDTVLTTEEDASPNGDPCVQDGSVEGEDMVEVTMTEPAEASANHPMSESSTGTQDQLPEVLQPGGFIPPEFRAMFTMKHTRSGKEMVPTGWNSVDHNKAYEEIAARVRQRPSRQSSVQSLEENSNPSSSEETEDNAEFSFNAQNSLQVADQSSEEEMQSIETPSASFNRGGRQKNSKKNSRKNKKAAKTYSKKGKDRFLEQPSQSFSEPESDDDESLLRLGEAIVLEWNSDAYDALFDGTNEQDVRGMDTLKFIETLKDPELQAKKVRRAARKKHGITLEECFAETSKSEVLSEDNAWFCNRCKEFRRATKTLEIWTAPDILVVHLKRFSAHRTFRDKIEALIDFPIEGLDLSGKFGLPEGKALLYDLFAVDNHFGGLGGGHYTAYAQNFFDKKWYNYNDSSVNMVKDPQSVVTSNAYLLFYRRRSSGPLGPPYIQEIVNAVMNPDSEEADDSDATNSRNPSRSPAGNGLRLGDSSRDGSSSAFNGAAAGALLRGGGSTSAGNQASRGAGVGMADDEVMHDAEQEQEQEQPPPYDEGYADDDEGYGRCAVNIASTYDHLYPSPGWGFGGVDNSGVEQVDVGDDEEVYDEDAASAAPNMGSRTGDELDQRMLEDFGDEIEEGIGEGIRARDSTPLLEEVDAPGLMEVGIEARDTVDDQVADVLLDDDEGQGHAKMD